MSRFTTRPHHPTNRMAGAFSPIFSQLRKRGGREDGQGGPADGGEVGDRDPREELWGRSRGMSRFKTRPPTLLTLNSRLSTLLVMLLLSGVLHRVPVYLPTRGPGQPDSPNLLSWLL